MTVILEHANLTVRDLDAALAFLQAAVPGWRVRGEGRMDWYGKPIRWVHLGDAQQYIALQSGGEGPLPAWADHALGVKHLGLVVDDLDAAITRLAALGHVVDHPGGDGLRRRAAYFSPDDLVQIELVQYLDADPAVRNHYG